MQDAHRALSTETAKVERLTRELETRETSAQEMRQTVQSLEGELEKKIEDERLALQVGSLVHALQSGSMRG